MKPIIVAQISGVQEKFDAYLMLLRYKYMNLCVKAEVGALMPVTVTDFSGSYDLEEVAGVGLPDEFHFVIYPRDPEQLQAIIKGIFDAHPEFKLDIKTGEVEYSDGSDDKTEYEGIESILADKNSTGDDDPKSRYLLYTMPEVDKDRRDLLNTTAKSLHKQCVAEIDLLYARQSPQLVNMLSDVPAEEVDEAKKALKGVYEDYKKTADDLLKAKLDEIEEGYQHYLVGRENDVEANKVYGQSLNFNEIEE
ncbi:MAG: hypothetical protein IJQ13_01620 [Prevotella sp.]|nr:hypothetical protein [Prevotella sp.]